MRRARVTKHEFVQSNECEAKHVALNEIKALKSEGGGLRDAARRDLRLSHGESAANC